MHPGVEFHAVRSVVTLISDENKITNGVNFLDLYQNSNFFNPFPVTVGYYPTNLEESGITRLTQNFPVDVFSTRCTGVWTSCLQGCETLNHFFSLLTLNMSNL